VKVFYTEVKDMLVNRRSKTFNDGVELNFVKCQQAISDSCGQFDYHYVTPFGQALAESNWDLAWPFFCYSRLVDLLFQVLICWYLVPISNDTDEAKVPISNERDEAKVQSDHERIRIPIIAIFLLGSHSALQLLRECINTYCLYRVEEKSVGRLQRLSLWLRHYFDFYSVVVVVIEVYSFCFVWELVVDRVVWPWYCHSDKSANSMCSAVEWMAGDVLVDTPFRLSMLIFAKWCYLMLSFMNSSVMLETLLPAWKAMTSRYSVAFLVYLLVLSFGTALAYYALPIRIDEESSNPYLEAFFRTSRLNLMGELNTDEFEGGDKGEGPHHTTRGRLLSADNDHPDNPANKYHWALQFFTLGCSVLFPVIALNLYVGMLSHAYEQARRHIVHSRGLLHSASSARAILGNHMGACMSKICAWHPCNWVYGRTFGWGTSWGETLCGAVWKDGGRDENAAIDETGTWIVIADTEDRDATQIPVELIQDEDMLSLLQNQEDEADVTESDSQALLAKEVAQAMQTLQKLQAKLNSHPLRGCERGLVSCFEPLFGATELRGR
jgi:hypothetical protein